jgi:hypothetical protein
MISRKDARLPGILTFFLERQSDSRSGVMNEATEKPEPSGVR